MQKSQKSAAKKAPAQKTSSGVQHFYRGYILCRLSKIGSEWEIVSTLQKVNTDLGKELCITYASPIYGAWDLIIEVSFAKLEELDKLVTLIRTNPTLQSAIEETTTFVSSRADYPW
ncbi:MAG TPA: hypothetical protein VKM55_03095 [Candidatus Lokiarchaeia archaeon]|nr:hypothetical protein [Candidatus Lokiarchaeia archaeon]